MNYLGLLKGEQWVEISEDFDYVRATQDFIGLKLFPMFKTDNMKVAVADLVEGSDVPVMALVHALDTEAKIGDRPNYEELKYELLLIKEKIDEGEALRKKIKDLGMSNEEKKIITAVYNDASNMISRVLTRFEVLACEAVSTGKATIKENNVDISIDYNLPEKHKMIVAGWGTITTDILGDLVKIQKQAKNKIVRALTSSKIMGYILNNTKLNTLAGEAKEYLTEAWAKNYIQSRFGIEFVVVDETYRKSAQDSTEYNMFNEDVVSFLTTDGALGYTYVTNTPAQDVGAVSETNGFITVSQWTTNDPHTVWTCAEGMGLPVFRNVKQLYICTVAN
ncbi:MAG: hypothetical protein EOL95_09445 [Bacteroidia bacterium]|nr:hypothetical protein [Bacteroidia bacterium]